MPYLGLMLPMAAMAIVAQILLIALMAPMGLGADNLKESCAFRRSNAFDGAYDAHGCYGANNSNGSCGACGSKR